MAMTVASVGRELFLKRDVNKASPDDLILHLFTNNYTPSIGDTVSNYTESTASGYAAITLTGSSWTVSTVSTITTASYGQQTFTYTGGESLFGYYVTDNTGAILIGAERFSGAPWTIPSAGGTVSLTPSFTLGVC